MVELKNKSDKINSIEEKDGVLVKLQANQFEEQALGQYKKILNRESDFLEGIIQENTEEILSIKYKKSSEMFSLEFVTKKMPLFDRLLLTQKLNFLVAYVDSPVQPFIHPANLFLFGDNVLVAHRGFMDKVAPYVSDYETNFKEYRAIILYIINPKLDYESLIEGNGTLKDALLSRIQETSNFEELEAILGEQITIQKLKRAQEKKVVNKNNYVLFKWSSIVLTLATIVLAITTGFYYFNIIPAKDRVIAAEAQFISSDYSGTLATLKDDKPEDLPIGAKYAAAVSSIQLDSLSNEQKEAILNNISQKSSENTLLYWVYIGKGNFEKALDIAQNVGDTQYILHAYTKLYDATKADNKMNGAKKQELLQKYEEEIKKYMEILGGKADGEDK